jgi:L-cysteine:1D-myo-inositol 2-amino-2-deoxy-alpha-D-glucopyranoside ligase
MQLYNSMSAQKEHFAPPSDRPVTLYVCGVTPYDTTHIGHARTFIIFDVLIRLMRAQGLDVRYCQNVTDVDDPLFERAARDGVHWRALAESQVAQFQEDCAGLNITPPTFFPRASEEIATMLPIIQRLIDLGNAYEREGNVYFSVQSDPSFGAMARMGYDEMLHVANKRGNRPDDPRKEDPLDFVLWQTGEPGDPIWESPWGPGRPGWHIECSAMSTRYLGEQIDIHGGGRDLLFPHHPCEIAQTENATGKRPFVRIWMHAGMVFLDGEKMSKSLGNMIFARDALHEYSATSIRWYLLSQPYRDDFYYERSDVPGVAAQAARFTAVLTLAGGDGPALDLSRERQQVIAALDDDLDTPRALKTIATMVEQVDAAATEGRDLRTAQATLREAAALLGLVA